MKPMRTTAAALAALMLFSSAASAGGHDRYVDYSPRHVKMSHGGNWVIPLVIGGVLGYALSEPRRETVTYVSAPAAPVVYAPQPVYQEQWVYFSDCDCQRKVLVPIR